MLRLGGMQWYVEFSSSRAWMHATCRSQTGARIALRLDLNHCVGNDNGKLVANKEGMDGPALTLTYRTEPPSDHGLHI